MTDERPITDFTRAFALHLGSIMEENGVKQTEVAEHIGRVKSYVSERLNGKRAVDTDMVDAVAELAGLDTSAVIVEIARRMAEPIAARDPEVRKSVHRIVRNARRGGLPEQHPPQAPPESRSRKKA